MIYCTAETKIRGWDDMGIRGEIFSTRSNSKSERRTYFFNVKENRNGDIFLNVVESKKHNEADFERHQIVVFQEDLEEFLQALGKAVETMKPMSANAKYPPRRPAAEGYGRTGHSRTGFSYQRPGTGENSYDESGRDPASE